MNYRILPPESMIEARVALPLSKSISNRLLIINALTAGEQPLPEIADCDDTRILTEALASADARVDVGNAGTAMRFLTALYAATPGREVTIDGSERMRNRPIGALVDALRKLGAEISYAGEEGFPPLKIRGGKLCGGEVDIDGEVSSQFVSALLMIAPTMAEPLTLRITGAAVSPPYIRMTLAMMAERGISCDYTGNTITVSPGEYRHADTPVEGDWSAAAFWYEIAALSAGMVTLDGLSADSRQGDAVVAKIFEQLGVNTDYEGEEGGIDLVPSPDQLPRLQLDMADTPDLVPPVVVTAAVLGIPFRITGLASLRIKESDRVEALMAELAKLGLMISCENNTLTWELERRPIVEMPRFEAHGDHRIAMALAPVALFVPGIVICDAETVEKSYPGYWDHLRAAGFSLLDGDAPLPEDNEEADEA